MALQKLQQELAVEHLTRQDKLNQTGITNQEHQGSIDQGSIASAFETASAAATWCFAPRQLLNQFLIVCILNYIDA